MRLAAGAIRELHWHQAAEWAYVSYGTCRIAVIDPKGRAHFADVKEGDLWYFPAGFPHSLQAWVPMERSSFFASTMARNPNTTRCS